MSRFRLLILASAILLLGWLAFSFFGDKHAATYNHESYKEVSLKGLSEFVFDAERGTLADIPSEDRALDGQKVMLEGEIYDLQDAGNNITKFQLVWKIGDEHHGPPHVQERVFCSAPNGNSMDYDDSRYQKGFGTLHVMLKHDKREDGRLGPVIEVYHLDAVHIEPSPE